MATEVTSQSAGQALDRSFTGLVHNQLRQPQMTTDGAEVQDDAAPHTLHGRHDRLRGEELVAEIHVDPAIPIRWRYIAGTVPIVIAGVVDENVNPTKLHIEIAEYRG